MMEELAVRRRGSITDEKGNEIGLVYCLTADRISLEGITAETYGVTVIAKLGSTVESKTVRDVSADIVRTEELIDLLWRNGVTPITLADIIDDYIEN